MICTFDYPKILNAAVTPIPACDELPLEVVARTPALITRVSIIDQIGQFLELYSGPVGQEELVHAIGNRNEVCFSCRIEAGSRLSVRSMDTAINSGNLYLGFY